jgi:UDPglucose--hexose-1-phosphate uridylyltransferase
VPPKGGENCPFCEGHEDRTPPEVFALRPGGGEPDSGGWQTRVVPNLYPALASETDAAAAAGGAGGGASPGAGSPGAEAGAFASSGDPLLASRRAGEPDLFSARPATGAHEVVIHSPRHLTAMAELTDTEFDAAVTTWRERMRAHAGASYQQLIVNEGGGAGASLEHSHAQLYALGFVPAEVARERERAGAYAERTAGSGLLSDVLVEEVRRRDRLVAIDDEAALFCPWASRSPFELRVVPRRESARFEEDTVGAAMLRTAMRLLAERFDGPPELNLWVRTAPRGAEPFHWHVDIAPRLTIKAGFELSTGIDINVYPPERAASDLRECLTS